MAEPGIGVGGYLGDGLTGARNRRFFPISRYSRRCHPEPHSLRRRICSPLSSARASDSFRTADPAFRSSAASAMSLPPFPSR
jgi:hypothetical protein